MQQLVPVEMSVEMSMAVHLQLMWEPCGDGDCRGRQFWMSLKCSIDDLYSLVRLVLAIILCMVGLANFLLSVILQVHAGAVFVVLPYGCILSGPHLIF